MPPTPATTAAPLTLTTRAGPEPITATLAAAGPPATAEVGSGDRSTRTTGPHILGRSIDCHVPLLADASISRRHAAVTCMGGGAGAWFVEDLASRSGTFINGVRLTPRAPTSIRAGDVLRLGSWEFAVTVAGATPPRASSNRTLMATVDDAPSKDPTAHSRIQRLSTDALERAGGSARRLTLLTEAVLQLGGADDEASLASLAAEAAVKGTGYGRAAVFRASPTSPGMIELVGHAGAGFASTEAVSRSLIAEAMSGQIARLTGGAPAFASNMSIAELGIHAALCVPVRIGETVIACLYLDSRAQDDSPAQAAETASFCDAIARVLGLAMAEFMRRDLEQRQLMIQTEIHAAREAQRLISPPPAGVSPGGHWSYAMRVQPGRFVAGDMVGVVPLPDSERGGGAMAIVIGDATGHGIGPAILMACAMAHLRAHLDSGLDIAAAMAAVNRFVCMHTEGGRFISMWLGVFEPGGLVRFIDAGHGHALFKSPGSPPTPLTPAPGIPLGIDESFTYTATEIAVPPAAAIILYSDGVPEERNSERECFGTDRLRAALTDGPAAAIVASVFETLTKFGGDIWEDDATLAVIRRES